MHTRRLLLSSSSSVYSSSSVLLRVSVFLAFSVNCFVDVVESISTDTSYVGRGGEVLLSCDYEGELSPRNSGAVSWLFEQKGGSARPLATAWNPSKQIQPQIGDSLFEGHASVSSQPGSASLHITDFQPEMEGGYKCQVILANLESKEFTYSVQLATLEKPSLVDALRDREDGLTKITIMENQATRIRCQVLSFPAPTISWRVNGVPVAADEVETAADARNPNLHMSEIQISAKRAEQGEVVECIADGPAVRTVTSLSTEFPEGLVGAASLNVQYPPDAPYITLEENQWFYTGTVVALGCSVSDRGNPPVKISMLFPDLQIAETTSASFVHKSFRLLPAYHGDRIACTAESRIKKLSKVTTKTLKVAYGPFDVQIDGNKDVVEDSPVGVELRCRASQANPRASITWSGFRPEVAKVVNQTRLKLKPTWRDNGAKILCTGSNPYNEDATKNVKAAVTLNVQYSPKWNGTEESMVVPKPIGQEALLHCDVAANPSEDLNFIWYFNGGKVDAGDVREIKIRAEASTFGVYTCRARNSVGSTDFHLELVDAAAIVQAKPPTALIGAIAAAIIVCIILLLIIVYCLRNRRSPASPRRSPSFEGEKRRDEEEEENHDDTPSNGKPANNHLIYSDVDVVTPTKEPNANNPLMKSRVPPTEYATIDHTRNGGTPAHRRPFGGVPVIVGYPPEGAHRLMKSTPI